MTSQIFIPAIVATLSLSACSSGTGTQGSVIYDTDTASSVARFSNGFATAPALGTISRVQYDEGTDTLTVTDATSPSTPITAQGATSVTAGQQNLRTYTAGLDVPDVNGAQGSPALGSELEILTVNSQNRNSWAFSIRETDYDTTSIPNFALWTDVGRYGAFGGDVYTGAIDTRRTGINGSATMNGNLVFTRQIVTDAIAVGVPLTRNGIADVALNVDFTVGTVGGTVSNISEVNAVTGAQTLAGGTAIVYTLPDATLAADGTFTGVTTTNTSLNGVNDQRTAHLTGQINGVSADEASGAIQLERVLTGNNGLGFGGETLRGTFVATE
jgi:hypothetical protein